MSFLIKNPYKTGVWKQKVFEQLMKEQPIRLFFTDIDSTLTGAGAISGNREAIKHLMHKLRRLGFIYIAVSSRTEEMFMSKNEYHISRTVYAFDRPRPKLKEVDGRQTYVDPLEFEPAEMINPDIIASSTGTKIYVRQMYGGYMEDSHYTADIKISPHDWQKKVKEYLGTLHPYFEYSIVDYKNAYLKGRTEIVTPDYRLDISFENFEKMQAFLNAFHPDVLIQFIDDSNPQKNQYAGYITPQHKDKQSAVDRIVHEISKNMNKLLTDLEIISAGDSVADVDAGLYAGNGSDFTFILVGGSRLSEYVLEKKPQFASHDLEEIIDNIVPQTKKGYYTFKKTHRTVIIGDEAYPDEKRVHTILSVIKEKYERT